GCVMVYLHRFSEAHAAFTADDALADAARARELWARAAPPGQADALYLQAGREDEALGLPAPAAIAWAAGGGHPPGLRGAGRGGWRASRRPRAASSSSPTSRRSPPTTSGSPSAAPARARAPTASWPAPSACSRRWPTTSRPAASASAPSTATPSCCTWG